MRNKLVQILTILLLISLIPGVFAAAGDLVFEKTFGKVENQEWGHAVDVDSDGTIFLIGVTYSDYKQNSNESGNGDILFVVTDKDGNLLLEKAFGGSGSDYGLGVHHLPDNNLILLATTGSEDGDVSDYYGLGDLHIIKSDIAGNIIWSKTYGGNLTDEGGDMVLTDDSGFLICGYSFSHQEPEMLRMDGLLWLLKLDSDGNKQWEKFYGGKGKDSGNSITKTSDGGYAIAGVSYSSDGDVPGNSGNSDYWVIKVDKDGNLLWSKNYGGAGSDWAHSIVGLPDGDMIVAGVTGSEGGTGDVSTSHGAGDIWLIRLDKDGNLLWEKSYGGSFSENIWSMKPSPSDGVYIVGETYSVDGDFSGIKGERDLFVAEISESGEISWYKLYGGSGHDTGDYLALNQDGDLIITGFTDSTDGDIQNSIGKGDMWLLKIDGSSSVDLTTITPLPGQISPPNDLNGDGNYEDLNGNGKLDLQDPTILFELLQFIKENYPPEFADFNKNGAADLGDVQVLFAEVSKK